MSHNVYSFELSLNRQYYICTGFVEGQEESVVKIPKTYNNLPVTAIGEKAFQNTEVQQVCLPNGITSIGEQAFYNCQNLVKVVLPYTLYLLGNGAFEDCWNLRTVVFLSKGYFSCSDNNNIFKNAGINNPYGIELKVGRFTEHIPDNLFCPCKGEESPNLHKITFNVANHYRTQPSTGQSVLTKQNWISQCKSIGKNSFKGCVDLMSIQCPDSLDIAKIDDTAFTNCIRLVEFLTEREIALDDIKGKFPFIMYSAKGTKKHLPKTKISANSSIANKFKDDAWQPLVCFILSSGTGDDYVINSERATKIQFLASTELGDVYTISNYAFYNKKLTELYIGQFCDSSDAVYEGDVESLPSDKSYTVYSCINKIGDYAFFNNDLQVCYVPADLEQLGAFAFSRTGLAFIGSGLQSTGAIDKKIFIEGDYSGEKFIHSEALCGYEDITLTTDTYLCPYAFKGVYSQKKGAEIKSFNSANHSVQYSEKSFNGAQYSSTLDFTGSYDVASIFPNDIITTATFCTNISSRLNQSRITDLVMAPDCTIADTALTCWKNLEIATLNNLSQNNYKFRELFDDTTEESKLISLTLNSIETIGSEGLYNLPNLKTLKLPGTLTEVHKGAFSYTIPNNLYLSSFDDWCAITFDPDNTGIYDGLTPFNKNRSNGLPVQNIYIGDNSTPATEVSLTEATTIADFSLYHCPFSDLTIPETVTAIGNYALYDSQIMNLTVAGPAVEYLTGGMWWRVHRLKIHGKMEEKRTKLTDKTMNSIVTLDLSEVQSYLADGFLSNLSGSETLTSLYLRSLKQNKKDGSPLYLINGSMFKRQNENGKTVNYGDKTVTPLGRLFSFSENKTRNDEISYWFDISTEFGSDKMNHYVFNQNNIRYCTIPNSLQNLYIKEGYIAYNAFGAFAGRTGVNIYVGENVQPSRRCCYDIDGNNCRNSNILGLGKTDQSNGYSAKFFLYPDPDTLSLFTYDLSAYDGVADYAFGWEKYNGYQRLNFKLCNTNGVSNLKYIGIRAFADCKAQDNVEFEIGTTTYKPDNSINIPSSVNTIGYLAFDSVTCNAVCLPTSVEKINSHAFDKLRLGNSSGNNDKPQHSIVFVAPSGSEEKGIKATIVDNSSVASEKSTYYYNNIFRGRYNDNGEQIYKPNTFVSPSNYSTTFNGQTYIETFGSDPFNAVDRGGLI